MLRPRGKRKDSTPFPTGVLHEGKKRKTLSVPPFWGGGRKGETFALSMQFKGEKKKPGSRCSCEGKKKRRVCGGGGRVQGGGKKKGEKGRSGRRPGKRGERGKTGLTKGSGGRRKKRGKKRKSRAPA